MVPVVLLLILQVQVVLLVPVVRPLMVLLLLMVLLDLLLLAEVLRVETLHQLRLKIEEDHFFLSFLSMIMIIN